MLYTSLYLVVVVVVSHHMDMVKDTTIGEMFYQMAKIYPIRVVWIMQKVVAKMVLVGESTKFEMISSYMAACHYCSQN